MLAAVSAQDGARLLVLARNHRWGEQPDRVLLSADAGASYRELTRGIKLTGAAFSPDGSAILVAGGDSLSRIEAPIDGAADVELVGMSQMLSCAQTGPQGLYACGHVNGYDPLVYGASLSTDQGESFQSLMSFTEVQERIGCANEAFSKPCEDQWIDWQLEILVGLGGAPIDSVEGWEHFKGIPEYEHPAAAHTLSTAQRTSTSTAGVADEGGGAAGAAASGGSAPTVEPERAQASEAGGCQSSSTRSIRGDAWGVLVLICVVVRRIRRTQVPIGS